MKKNGKNHIFFTITMMVLLAFGLVFTGCPNSPGGGGSRPKPPVGNNPGSGDNGGSQKVSPVEQHFSLTARDKKNQRQVFSVGVTGEISVSQSISSRSAAARNSVGTLPDGWYEYEVKLGDITISKGVLEVKNGVYTFYEGATLDISLFTYDPDNGEVDGKIPVSQQVKEAVEKLGAELPNELDLESMAELREGSDNYWDGWWDRMVPNPDYPSDPSAEMFITDGYLLFNGNYYTLHIESDDTYEDGTFYYCDGSQAAPDSVFLFFRYDAEPKVLAYMWEGENEPDHGFIEFYNYLTDPMLIDRSVREVKFEKRDDL